MDRVHEVDADDVRRALRGTRNSFIWNPFIPVIEERRDEEFERLLLIKTSEEIQNYIQDNPSENVINNLHFLWIGSALNAKNTKAFTLWAQIMQNCAFNIYMWYDGRIITPREEKESLAFVKKVIEETSNQRVYFCDFFAYDFTSVPQYREAIRIYNYEVGKEIRPGLDDFSLKLKNWGMASDILRMMILYIYGGFYMDIDMKAVNLCQYRHNRKTKTCPRRFCHNQSLSYDLYYGYEVYDGGRINSRDIDESFYNNNALYLDPKYDFGFVDSV